MAINCALYVCNRTSTFFLNYVKKISALGNYIVKQGRQTRQNSGGGCRFHKGGLQNVFNFYAIKISTF